MSFDLLMSRRTESLAVSKYALIESAVHLFAKSGFSQTTTAQIAQHAGYSHGMLFTHFSSRIRLVEAAIETMGAKITDALYSIRGTSSLEEALAAHIDAIEKNGALYRSLLHELHGLPRASQRIWLGIQSAASHHLGTIVAQEQTEGKLKRIEHALLFNTWLGLLHHYLANEVMFAPRGHVLTKMKTILIGHFLTLVRESI